MVVYREIYGNYMVNIVIYGEYPLVMTNITIETHHFQWENSPFSMAMFNSYVCLTEGNPSSDKLRLDFFSLRRHETWIEHQR